MKVTNTLLDDKLSINNNSKPLKEGMFIKGKITEINGNDVALRLSNGEVLQAKTNFNIEGLKDILYTFMVKNIEDNKIFLLPIEQEILETSNIHNNNNSNKLESFIYKLLEDYNIPKNDENFQIIDTILRFKIPLTQENIDKVIKSVNKILNLCDLQANSKIIALDSEKNPLKESIVNLIKVGSDVEPLTNTHSKGVVESGYEDSKINQLLSSDNNKNFIDVTKLVSSKLHALLSEHISTKSIISKVALLTKLGAEVSIENYEILSNIIENGKEITKSQDELTNKDGVHNKTINNFSKEASNTFSKIGFKLFNINSENSFNKEAVKSYLNNIKELTEQTNRISTKQSDISESSTKLDYLLKALDLNDKLNTFYSLLQIPIEFSGEENDGQLTILKKKSKNEKNTYTFYISLDTEYLNKVDVLCKIRQNDIRLDFKVEDECIQFFRSKIKYLSRALEDLGYQNIRINVREDKDLSLIDIFMEDGISYSSYSIDIRV